MKIEKKLHQDAERQRNGILADNEGYYACIAPQTRSNYSQRKRYFSVSRIAVYGTCALALILVVVLGLLGDNKQYNAANEMAYSQLYGIAAQASSGSDSSQSQEPLPPSSATNSYTYDNVQVTDSAEFEQDYAKSYSPKSGSVSVGRAQTSSGVDAVIVRRAGRVPLDWSLLNNLSYKVSYDLVLDGKSNDELYYLYTLDNEQYGISIKTVVNDKYPTSTLSSNTTKVVGGITVSIEEDSTSTQYRYQAQYVTQEGYIVIIAYSQSTTLTENNFTSFLQSAVY